MAKRRRRFTREFKLAELARLEEASLMTTLADELGIGHEVLCDGRLAPGHGGDCMRRHDDGAGVTPEGRRQHRLVLSGRLCPIQKRRYPFRQNVPRNRFAQQ